MSATERATLVEFLTARIEEDEAAARDASSHGAEWFTQQDDGWSPAITAGSPDGEVVVYDEGSPTPEQSCHIARHDPARVLAECEAKRRIAEALEDERQRKDIYNRDFDKGLLTTDDDRRRRLSANARWAGLEVAVRALVQPYADHPDYDETWRP